MIHLRFPLETFYLIFILWLQIIIIWHLKIYGSSLKDKSKTGLAYDF